MAIEIKMPALSPTMTEGRLSRWLVAQGDSVASGDVIAEIETDKATMEVEALDDGVMAKLVVAEGAQNVAVNALIAVLAEAGEDASAAAKEAENASVAALSPTPASEPAATPAPAFAPTPTSAPASVTAPSAPAPIPLPIIVEPAFDITLLTSAKSKFISPGFVISSAIPPTALSRTAFD